MDAEKEEFRSQNSEAGIQKPEFRIQNPESRCALRAGDPDF